MNLTEREREIVALLRRDPLIGSAAIAEALGTTRAAVNVHLSNLTRKGVVLGRGYVLSEGESVVVVGGANMDIKARSVRAAVPATSNPGAAAMAAGGVGRNIAENLARLGTRTHLIAGIGTDALGDQVLSATSNAGVRVEHVRRDAASTGTYTAVLDANGELVVAVADMAATEMIDVEQVADARDLVAAASLLVLDGNLATATLSYALDLAADVGTRVVLDPVSVPKATLVAPLLDGERPVFAITPNRDELAALTDLPTRTRRQQELAVRALHDRGVEVVWVRLGPAGSLLGTGGGIVTLDSVDAGAGADVVDVTGAGDSMTAAFCHALLEGADPAAAAAYGHAAAALTVASPHTVRPDLTDRLIRSLLP